MGTINESSLANLLAKWEEERAKKKYITFQVLIGGKDYTNNTPFPIKWSSLLDERLDECRISLKYCKAEIFTPLTPVQIILHDQKDRERVLNFVVASDDAQELPVGSGRYNHELMLIEQTKILEGIVVDALTFTNDLGRSYTENATQANFNIIENDYTSKPYIIPETYKSALPTGEKFTFIKATDFFTINNIRTRYRLSITLNGSPINDPPSEPVPENDPSNQNNFSTILVSGTYVVDYWAKTLSTGSNPSIDCRGAFTFIAVQNQDPLPKWTITSVINRVLDLAEPHLKGVEPRFYLNHEQAVQFDSILSPEFAFTRATLKEILDQIGGFIHGIPRLNGNEIVFDMLGGTELAKLANPKYPYIANFKSQNIENYCTTLDSNVDNLACILDPEQGVLTEPYIDGYKTLRTETVYARIEEGNMFIATQYPIQEIKSVHCGFIPGTNFKGGDITPYVFEIAEYNKMSSYKESYPDSKAYALYYTQGTKNIYGLNFKYSGDWISGGAYANYAIINILEKTSGQSIGGLGEDYPLLAFQVSYIPIFGARVQQSKQYIGDIQEPRTLVYNQGANLVETRYYGENLKGVVARMGNVEMTRTYQLRDFGLIPSIGQMFDDDYYISEVTCEVMPDSVKCMIGLSKDFNRLSQYIGINSRKRFYEVSEKQAYQRDISYLDYCVIGDGADYDLRDLIFENGIAAIKDIFTQTTTTAVPLSMALSQGIDSAGEEQALVALPIISVALGDAMVFTFNYEDNYSAGAQSNHSTEGNVEGYFTNSVAYADYYGRLKELQFWLTQGENAPADSAEQARIGKVLPQYEGNGTYKLFVGTKKPLTILKDGSEILSINYQLEFVTNKRNYIIGSALARNCSLVRGYYEGHSAKLYILPNRLSKFTDVVNLAGATEIADYGTSPYKITIYGKRIKFADETATADGQSWAIVDKQSGELLIGANLSITAGDMLTMPYMTFTHNIFNS